MSIIVNRSTILKNIVEDYLQRFSSALRPELDKLLMEKLSEALTADQKRHFITNLLQEMRREKNIQPVKGKRGKGSEWELYKPVKKSLA